VTVALDFPVIPLASQPVSQPPSQSRVEIWYLLSLGGLDRVFSARWTAISLQMRFFRKVGAVLSRLETLFLALVRGLEGVRYCSVRLD
jgi:hypothetical protein